MTWRSPEVTRVDWPFVAEERAQLEGLLDWHRQTLLMKCGGLTAEQLKAQSLPASDLSLLGIVRHITDVERGWFWDFAGEFTPLYWTADELARRVEGLWSDFAGVPDADAEADLAAYRKTCERSGDLVAGRSLDDTFTDEEDRTFTLRWVYLHMIEEYARHNGHADLLREHIDGITGE